METNAERAPLFDMHTAFYKESGKMSKTQKEQNDIIAKAAVHALTAEGFETESGLCLRWVRQVVERSIGEKNWPVPRGSDAGEALAYFAKKGWVLSIDQTTMPGDLIFWVGEGHGKHGHVAIRIYGNKIAENGSMHVGRGDTDARGTRSLPNYRSGIRAVRLPVAKTR